MLSGEPAWLAKPRHDDFSQPSHITLISREGDILYYLSRNGRIIGGGNEEFYENATSKEYSSIFMNEKPSGMILHKGEVLRKKTK